MAVKVSVPCGLPSRCRECQRSFHDLTEGIPSLINFVTGALSEFSGEIQVQSVTKSENSLVIYLRGVPDDTVFEQGPFLSRVHAHLHGRLLRDFSGFYEEEVRSMPVTVGSTFGGSECCTFHSLGPSGARAGLGKGTAISAMAPREAAEAFGKLAVGERKSISVVGVEDLEAAAEDLFADGGDHGPLVAKAQDLISEFVSGGKCGNGLLANLAEVCHGEKIVPVPPKSIMDFVEGKGIKSRTPGRPPKDTWQGKALKDIKVPASYDASHPLDPDSDSCDTTSSHDFPECFVTSKISDTITMDTLKTVGDMLENRKHAWWCRCGLIHLSEVTAEWLVAIGAWLAQGTDVTALFNKVIEMGVSATPTLVLSMSQILFQRFTERNLAIGDSASPAANAKDPATESLTDAEALAFTGLKCLLFSAIHDSATTLNAQAKKLKKALKKKRKKAADAAETAPERKAEPASPSKPSTNANADAAATSSSSASSPSSSSSGTSSATGASSPGATASDSNSNKNGGPASPSKGKGKQGQEVNDARDEDGNDGNDDDDDDDDDDGASSSSSAAGDGEAMAFPDSFINKFRKGGEKAEPQFEYKVGYINVAPASTSSIFSAGGVNGGASMSSSTSSSSSSSASTAAGAMSSSSSLPTSVLPTSLPVGHNSSSGFGSGDSGNANGNGSGNGSGNERGFSMPPPPPQSSSSSSQAGGGGGGTKKKFSLPKPPTAGARRKQCVICNERFPSALARPCSHATFCAECLAERKANAERDGVPFTCLVCDRVIEQVLNIRL